MSTDAKIPEGKLAGSSWPWTGLAARLFALVLIAILPALAIQAYNEIMLKRSRETEVRTDALRLAKFAAGELDRIIDNGRTLLVAVTHYPAVRNRDAKTCSDFFAGLSKVFPQYLGSWPFLMIMRRAGSGGRAGRGQRARTWCASAS